MSFLSLLEVGRGLGLNRGNRLIDKDYMERLPGGETWYQYVA